MAAPAAYADSLTEADREALLEKLEAIRNEADSKVDARFRTAMAAFKSGMSSDDAAITLYLNCEEMVNFQEMKKKSGDFREWKRDRSDKLSDKDFKMALRQQLRWLVLTLEAASEEPDLDRLGAEASTVLASIVSQAEDLSAHRNTLQQAVTSSVFARAYDINNLKVEKWPLAPMQLDAVYDQVILPPLRRSDRLPSLKAAWTRRMVQEGTLADLWSGKPGEKLKIGRDHRNTKNMCSTLCQKDNGRARSTSSKQAMNVLPQCECSHISRKTWRTNPPRSGLAISVGLLNPTAGVTLKKKPGTKPIRWSMANPHPDLYDPKWSHPPLSCPPAPGLHSLPIRVSSVLGKSLAQLR